MSLLTKHVIPGRKGKVFGTDAKNKDDLRSIKKHLLSMAGVKDVQINPEAFPVEITIYTTRIVQVRSLQERVMEMGFHIMPKGALSI